MKSIIRQCLVAIFIAINATSGPLFSMQQDAEKKNAHVSKIAAHHTEEQLFYQLFHAIKYRELSQTFKLIKDLKTYYPCTTMYCSHTTNALGAAAALNRPEMFELIRETALATARTDIDLAVYAGVALERAAMAGWEGIVKKIFHEKVPIPTDFLQAAILTACARTDRSIIRVFVDYFGFEITRQLMLMPTPKEMRIYLPDGYEIPCPVRLDDLLGFLDEFKSK